MKFQDEGVKVRGVLDFPCNVPERYIKQTPFNEIFSKMTAGHCKNQIHFLNRNMENGHLCKTPYPCNSK